MRVVIDQIEIDGFKCFRAWSAPLRPLTILAGPNNAGKSSLLQALLLCHLASRTAGDKVPLNGALGLQLGTVADTLRGDEMRVSLKAGEERASWVLGGKEEERFLRVRQRPEALPEVFRSVDYLAAERLGPRLFHRSTNHEDADREEQVGSRGEFTAHILDARAETQVPPARLHPAVSSQNHRLARQVEAWLGEITPGIQVRTSRIPAIGLANLEVKVGGAEADWLRPPSMGFGISYVLPILVAGLSAPPGALLLIENPEAHLHPRGQSILGKFLARMANAGVQIVLETHSDHLLNGARLACVRGEIAPEQIVILFFEGRSGKVTPITVDASGALSHEPPSFFDQSERDILAIVRERGLRG